MIKLPTRWVGSLDGDDEKRRFIKGRKSLWMICCWRRMTIIKEEVWERGQVSKLIHKRTYNHTAVCEKCGYEIEIGIDR